MITLKQADFEKILAHAKKELPNEACGLIAGVKDGADKHIQKVYLLTNIDWFHWATGILIRNRHPVHRRKTSGWHTTKPQVI